MAEQSYGHLRSFTTATAVDISVPWRSIRPLYSSVRIAAFCVVIKTVTAGTNVVTVKPRLCSRRHDWRGYAGYVHGPGCGGEQLLDRRTSGVVNSSTGASTCILSPGEAISFTPAGSSTGAFYCGFLGYEFEEPPPRTPTPRRPCSRRLSKHRSGQNNITQLVFTAA